jgi:hypothetical protein
MAVTVGDFTDSPRECLLSKMLPFNFLRDTTTPNIKILQTALCQPSVNV